MTLIPSKVVLILLFSLSEDFLNQIILLVLNGPLIDGVWEKQRHRAGSFMAEGHSLLQRPEWGDGFICQAAVSWHVA